MMGLHKIGIRSRMFAAFGIVAAVTIATSIIAWVAYERLGNSVQDIAHRDIVAVSLASELTEKGGIITATAPSFVAATDDDQREDELGLLRRTLGDMEQLVDRIHSDESDQEARLATKKLLAAVASNLGGLDVVVRQRIWFHERNRELSVGLRWAHADLLDEVEPMIKDARFIIGLNLENEQPDGRNETLAQKIAQQEALLRIKAAGNLLVSLISRGATMTDKKSLEDTRHFAREIASPVAEDFAPLQKISGVLSLRQSFNSVMRYVNGDNSLFDLRADELDLTQKGKRLLDANRTLVQSLQEDIAAHVKLVKQEAQSAADASAAFLNRTRLIFVAAALASIVIAVLVVWLYVGRNLVSRITALDVSMRRIASGDLDAEVPTGGSDEIADMARSLGTFRDTLSETQAELIQAGKLAALGQLTAGIAHELNQPLTAIRSRTHSAQVLLKRQNSDAVQDNLGSIASLAGRMADKINHLKTLARKPSKDIAVVELERVVSGALDLLRSRISSEGVSIINRLAGSKVHVRGGAIRLEQVMLNVIGNALDAMKGCPKRQLTVSADVSSDIVVVQISDTGSGIDRNEADQVFDPFFTTKDVGEGLGLGLSISFNILKDLGGSISCTSVDGKGTTFFISLINAEEMVPA